MDDVVVLRNGMAREATELVSRLLLALELEVLAKSIE